MVGIFIACEKRFRAASVSIFTGFIGFSRIVGRHKRCSRGKIAGRLAAE